MKQHITVSQLNQLNKKGKKRLDEWFCRQPYTYTLTSIQKVGETGFKNNSPLLSIGQMIEFLDENGFYIDNFMEQFISKDKKYWEITYLWLDRAHVVSKTELCDALWEAVKEVLNG